VTRLKAFVSNPVEPGPDEPVSFYALEHVASATGRLVSDTVEERSGADCVAHRPGDVRFGKLRPYLAKSILMEDHAAGSGELLVLRPDPSKLDARYLWYVTLSKSFVDWATATSYGVKMPRTNWQALAAYDLDPPPVSEQRQVAEALDRATSTSDRLIAEQEHLINLLWEHRKAAIFDAVTGQRVPGDRRPGLPWVESVPAHWEVSKLLHFATLGSGHTPARNRPELWEECTIPWVTTGEVWQIRSDVQEVLTETRENISLLGVAESAAVVHPAGTVVLCRTAASAGYSAIMGFDMATSQDFATWTCGPHLQPRFLLYCLRAMRRDLLERLAVGSTHRTIYMPEIKSIVVPVPPVEEQEGITAELHRRLDQLDRARAEAETQVKLLREHRQALITAAVTRGLEAFERSA
jgi:type I restriction enzyme S subunit